MIQERKQKNGKERKRMETKKKQLTKPNLRTNLLR